MAITNKIYKQFYNALLNKEIDIDSDTIKLALLKGTYTPDMKQDDAFADVVAYETTSSDYTTGGETVSNISVTSSTANYDITIDGDDVTWSSVTLSATYACLYASLSTNNANNKLICLIDFGATEASNAGDFTVQWGSSGILKINVSS